MSGSSEPIDVLDAESTEIRVRHLPGIRVAEVRGPLDLLVAPRLAKALDHPGQSAIVDCRACSFVDSTGLVALLAARRRYFDAGYGFAVVRTPGGRLDRILAMTGVVELLAVYDSLDAAAAALIG